MITLPDGTTAQVQGVAQMDPGQGAVHTLAEVASQHSSIEVGHSSDLQENGHIIITGDDGQGKIYNYTLFIKKRFVLNKMFQRNASKFAIFYV